MLTGKELLEDVRAEIGTGDRRPQRDMVKWALLKADYFKRLSVAYLQSVEYYEDMAEQLAKGGHTLSYNQSGYFYFDNKVVQNVPVVAAPTFPTIPTSSGGY